MVGGPKAEVDPAQLPAGVPTTDRPLAAQHPICGPHLDPGPDRIAVGAVVREPQLQPMAERRRDPSDRRRMALYLTEAGRPAWMEARITSTAHDRAVIANLDESEVTLLIDLLKRLRR